MSASSSSYHPAKSLRHVILTASVYHACLVHALSTEREEIMGLLMGQTTVDGDAHIWHSTIIPRLDKRPDRVEISSERLVAAPEDAMRIGRETGLHTRVLGWYHSHPHITPYPSHVDLQTQATYQLMDPVWVGLIFSVFTDQKSSSSTNYGNSGNYNNNSNNSNNGGGASSGNKSSSSSSSSSSGRVALHCFQSIVRNGGSDVSHRRVPVTVVPDDFFFSGSGNKPSSSEAFISPSLTILSEAKEMKDTVAREVEEEISLEKKKNNTNNNKNNNNSTSTSTTIEEFDHVLYDEACKNVIETQTFAVCQKMLRPLLDDTVFDNMERHQQNEIEKNEEILKSLREEVKQLKETSALKMLEMGK